MKMKLMLCGFLLSLGACEVKQDLGRNQGAVSCQKNEVDCGGVCSALAMWPPVHSGVERTSSRRAPSSQCAGRLAAFASHHSVKLWDPLARRKVGNS